jgi:hypothetical protein
MKVKAKRKTISRSPLGRQHYLDSLVPLEVPEKAGE